MTSKKPRLMTVTQGMITRSGNKQCNLCLKQIKLEDKIVSKSASNDCGHTTKWYHRKCARRVNII
jgi:hypothetical protein